MSFILDALKKSESERRRQDAPGIADVAAAAPRSRLPLWSIVLGGLLGINLLVLVVYVMRREAPTPIAEPAHPAHAAGAPAEKPFSPLDTGPADAPEIPVADAALPNAAAAAPPVAAAAARPALALPAPSDEEPVPTIYDLTASGRQNLPEMHLDIHVFATSPADRFVFINGRKYREGAATAEGATIARITPDGVVMDYRGLRFLLPRQ